VSDLARRIREARQAKGISVADAEISTKIRRRFINAIEAGDYAQLPDGLASRGFIKNYARYLDIDIDQALADYEAEVGVLAVNAAETIPPPPTRKRAESKYTQMVPLPDVHYTGELPSDDDLELDAMVDEEMPSAVRYKNGAPVRTGVGRNSGVNTDKKIYVNERRDYSQSESSFKLNAPRSRSLGEIVDGISTFSKSEAIDGLPYAQRKRVSPSVQVNPRGVFEQIGNAVSGIPRRVWLIAGSALLALALIFGAVNYVVPAVGKLLGATASTATATAVSAARTSAPTVAANGTAPATSAIQPTAAVTRAPVIAPAVGGGMDVTLDVIERAWMRVSVDSKVVFEGIPQIGPNLNWKVTKSLGIETGNAGAVEVILNGTRVGAPGARNAIARVQYDTNGKLTPLP
jgi:cytoskeletal protein RodZ